MGGLRNRNAGNGYERQIAQELRDKGYEAITSRQGSRALDSMGVDLVTNFVLAPQMKCMINTPNIERILSGCAGIIFWKKTRKHGTRFMPVDEYVVMRKEDFYTKFL